MSRLELVLHRRHRRHDAGCAKLPRDAGTTVDSGQFKELDGSNRAAIHDGPNGLTLCCHAGAHYQPREEVGWREEEGSLLWQGGTGRHVRWRPEASPPALSLA